MAEEENKIKDNEEQVTPAEENESSSEDNNQVFREKSLERVSSPEELNDYIKTTTPSLWILLIAIIVFLVGLIVWATVGTLESNHKVGCIVQNGTMTCLIPEADKVKATADSYVLIGEKQYPVVITDELEEATLLSDSQLLHYSELEIGDWYYYTVSSTDLEDGYYNGKIVYEQINPIKFVIN